jgi:hypothetical protein
MSINSANSIIGVSTAIAGNLLISVALNLQKYVHNTITMDLNTSLNTPQTNLTTNKPSFAYLEHRLWWLGMALLLVGETGNFIAYGFASAVLIAPLGTVALVKYP